MASASLSYSIFTVCLLPESRTYKLSQRRCGPAPPPPQERLVACDNTAHPTRGETPNSIDRASALFALFLVHQFHELNGGGQAQMIKGIIPVSIVCILFSYQPESLGENLVGQVHARATKRF